MRECVNFVPEYAGFELLDYTEPPTEEAVAVLEDLPESEGIEASAEENGLEDGDADWHEQYNPLKTYLTEIGSIPLLKRSEETEVSKRIEDNRQRATRVLFSLPLAVERLLQRAGRVRLGEAYLKEFIHASTENDQAKDNEKKAFIEAIMQIHRMHRLKLPSMYCEKISALISALRLRFEFVERIVTDIRTEMLEIDAHLAGMSERRANRERIKVEENIGSALSAIPAVLRAFTDARTEMNDARKILIEANLRLVVSAAKRYAAMGRMSMLDLIQEGNIGLMRSVDLFDYRKGFKFSTYAMCWIKQTITRALSTTSRTIRLPVHSEDELTKIMHAVQHLTNESAEEPSHETIAKRVKISEHKVRRLLEISRDPLSLHLQMGEDESEMIDFIEDKSMPSPLEHVIQKDMREKMQDMISQLNVKEEMVLRKRFGIGREEQTLQILANEFGVTRERIRQIETTAIKKLRRHFAAASA